MKTKYPIFILSKGRADKNLAKTFGLLMQEPDYEFTIVVEPQDQEAYTKMFFPNGQISIFVLKQNDMGIPFARQSLLEYCRSVGIEKYWQLDDNMTAFIERKEDKTKVKVSPQYALSKVEEIADSYKDIKVAGLNYEVTAHWATEPYTFNKGVYCAVLTSTDTGIDYDLDIEIEDLNFVLKHLKAGYNTLLSNNYVMVKPKTGATPGGNRMGLYSSKEHYENAIKMLHEKHPDCTRFHTRKIGWIGIRTSWKNFKRQIEKC
jgi:hypothetical protein